MCYGESIRRGSAAHSTALVARPETATAQLPDLSTDFCPGLKNLNKTTHRKQSTCKPSPRTRACGYGLGRPLQYRGLWKLLPAAAVAGGEGRVSKVGDELKVGRSFGGGRCSTSSSGTRDCLRLRLARLENLALPRLPALPATGSSRPLSETRRAGYPDGETQGWI